MAKQIITKEEAEQAAAEQSQPPEVAQQRAEAPKGIKFRTSNIGLVYFPDGTTFAFHKPVMTIHDPALVEKLTEMATRTPTHIHLIEEPQPATL